MSDKPEDSIRLFPIILGGLLIILGAYYMLFMRDEGLHTLKPKSLQTEPATAGVSCNTTMDSVIMNEDVMEGVIKSAQKVSVEIGYYNCKEPVAGDVVLVKTSGRPDPIIRFVRVLPKDSFKLERKQDRFHLKVNGSVVSNADGKPYAFDENKSRLLQLYERSLKGKMEDGIYFIFSNRTDGGYDSTRFGPVEKSKLIGKVILSH